MRPSNSSARTSGICAQRSSIRAGLLASSGWSDAISPSSRNETQALNRSCNASVCSSEPSHSPSSFITRTTSFVFASCAMTSITPTRFFAFAFGSLFPMQMIEYWTLAACSRKLSEFCACHAVASRRRVRRSTRTMIDDLTAEEVRILLKLEPHATCGFVRVSFISKKHIAPGGLPAPFLDGRPAGSALYFMVTPDAPVRLHRIRNDQLYHRYLGDPIEVLMLHENGTTERAIVGPDLRAGQCVQLLIPGNTFHTARVIPEGVRGWFLGASTEWPGVERVDVEIGDVEALAAKYPDVADDLRAFQQGRGD